MKFSALFVLASVVVSTFATTPAQVEADVNTISSQVTALDNSITAFPTSGGTLAGALAIHNAAVTLGSTVDKGTADAKAVTPNPVSEADGNTILSSLQALEPVIEHALTGIVAKKAAFQALPIGGIPALVKQDLSNLSASTSALEAALIAAAPSDLVATATALENRINAAFATAIAAYA